MKKFFALALGLISFSNFAHAEIPSESVIPAASCKGYESNTLELLDTDEPTIKIGTLNFYGEVKTFSCLKAPKADVIHPDQAEHFYSCKETEEGSFSISIQSFGILPANIAYIFNEGKMVDMLGCKL